MTLKRQKFVRAYLGDCNGNATKAAIAAGYSEASATKIGAKLLTFADVKSALSRGLEKAGLTTDQCLSNLATIANASPKQVQAKDVIAANALILKVNGALKDKAQSSGLTVNIGYLLANRNTPPAADIINVAAQVTPQVMTLTEGASSSEDGAG